MARVSFLLGRIRASYFSEEEEKEEEGGRRRRKKREEKRRKREKRSRRREGGGGEEEGTLRAFPCIVIGCVGTLYPGIIYKSVQEFSKERLSL